MSASTKNVLRAIKAVSGKTPILNYVRNSYREPIGVVIAIGPNKVGWSRTHQGQIFNSTAGVMMAFHNALNGGGGTERLNSTMKKAIEAMKERSTVYYHADKPHKSKFIKKVAE